jgi:uncharacterized protein YbaP (TraB family)
MPRKITSFLILLSFSLVSLDTMAQSRNGLLWEISGNEIVGSSYLFGTLHAICPEDLVMVEKVLTALSKTQELILEIDLDDPDLYSEMLKGMMLNDSIKMDDYLTSGQIDTLSTLFADSLRISFDAIRQLKPVMMSGLLIPVLSGCAVTSVEETLMKETGNLHMKITGLETVTEQLAILDLIPISEQYKLLYETVSDLKQARFEYSEMLRLYRAGEIDSLLNMPVFYDMDPEVFRSVLIGDRNLKWTGKIDSIVRSRSVFIAVGVGHLGGEAGLIELLIQRGFTLRPLQDK